MNRFAEYVDVCHDGNQAKAAAALGVDRSLVNRIIKGTRSVTPDLAELVEKDSEGRYQKASLIWPDTEAANDA